MTAALLHHLAPAALLLQRLRHWWRRSTLARQRRAELRALQALGQHELNDLGVGHSELPGLGCRG